LENRKSLLFVAVALIAIVLFTSSIFSASSSLGFAQQSQQTKYPFTIVAVGDWDCNADTKKTVANVEKQNPDIILALGDLSYAKSAKCWLDLIAPIKNKMLIVQGNHDDNFDDYMAAFGMSESWYAKEVPQANALFVGINTEESLKAGSPQLKFVEKALTDSNADWKITFMHKPSITYGHHMSDEGAPETLLPLYDKTKTSIEFSGHNHFMQEIYPTTDGTGEPHKTTPGEGTVHIVSGGGGRDLYEYEDNEVVAQSVADHGIVKTVLLDDKNAKSEFISNDGKITKMADIINRNYEGTTEPPAGCDPGMHLENDVCVPDTTEPPTTEPPTPAATNTSQILITSNIQKTESKGEYQNQEYKDTYNVRNLFDNLTNTWSFWSQYGNSGFIVDLDKPLDKLLCNIQLDAYNPQNQNYKMRASDSNDNPLLNFNGSLSTSKTTIDIQGCIADVDKIGMMFDNPDKWVTLAEVKLFTNSSTMMPPVEPNQCLPGWHYDEALRKCIEDVVTPPVEPPTEPPVVTPPPTPINGSINIVNSTATIKALNTNFTIIFYDNDTSTEWENNITDINETEIDNSPIQFSSSGGAY
jgi:predicted phosphodiesterase